MDGRALLVGPVAGLDQGEKPGQPSHEERARDCGSLGSALDSADSAAWQNRR